MTGVLPPVLCYRGDNRETPMIRSNNFFNRLESASYFKSLKVVGLIESWSLLAMLEKKILLLNKVFACSR